MFLLPVSTSIERKTFKVSPEIVGGDSERRHPNLAGDQAKARPDGFTLFDSRFHSTALLADFSGTISPSSGFVSTPPAWEGKRKLKTCFMVPSRASWFGNRLCQSSNIADSLLNEFAPTEKKLD